MEVKPLSPRERIEKLTLRLNITRRELARISRIGEDTIYHAGDNSRPLTERTASKICYHVERELGVVINRDWILSGTGDMVNEKLSVPYDTEPAPIHKAAEEPAPYGSPDWRSKYFDLWEKYTDLQERYAALLEKLHQQ